MKNLLTTITFTLITSVIVNAQSDQKSLEIINKSIDAIGGKKKLENVKTLYTEMQINNDPVFYITKEKAPNKGSLEVKVNGNSVFGYRFDGEKGFEKQNGQIKQMPDEEITDKKNRKYIFNELAYIDPTIWTFNYVGEVDLNNSKAHKLKGENKNGTIEYIYFDSNNFRKVKSENIVMNDENNLSTFEYLDYRTLDGLIVNYKLIHTDPKKVITRN